MDKNIVRMTVNFPLDGDGFLRRECPTCQREFKWFPTQPEDEATPSAEAPSDYFCPLCGVPAAASSFLTRAQADHATEVVKKQALQPILRNFQSGLQRLNRPGAGVRVTTKPVNFPEPHALPAETNDMKRVVPHCHPAEPLKVPDDWSEAVHCLVCGERIDLRNTTNLSDEVTPPEAG